MGVQKRMRILLDAGHGGTDPGATYELETQTLKEADINLEIVMRMRDRLRSRFPGWDVRLSRVDDTYISPGARARQILRSGVNAAVSIHCNSSAAESATGHEVIYREGDDKTLAEAISAELKVGYPALRDRGIKSDLIDLGRKLALLSTPGVPTVIVEPGFISNEKDREVLLDFETLSGILTAGIERWAQEQKLT